MTKSKNNNLEVEKDDSVILNNETLQNIQKKDFNICKVLFFLLIGVVITLFVLDAVEIIDVVFQINPSGYNDDVCEDECDCDKDEGENEIPFYNQSTSESEKKKYLKKLCKIELDYEEMYYNGQTYDANDLDEGEFLDENGIKPAEMCFNGACLIVDKSQKLYLFDCDTEEYIVQSFEDVIPNLSLSTACSMVDNNGNYFGDDNNLYCNSFVCTYDYNGKKYEKDCRE